MSTFNTLANFASVLRDGSYIPISKRARWPCDTPDYLANPSCVSPRFSRSCLRAITSRFITGLIIPYK